METRKRKQSLKHGVPRGMLGVEAEGACSLQPVVNGWVPWLNVGTCLPRV